MNIDDEKRDRDGYKLCATKGCFERAEFVYFWNVSGVYCCAVHGEEGLRLAKEIGNTTPRATYRHLTLFEKIKD